MVNYSFAKVYKIEPKCLHEEGEIYIGSTAQTALCLRFQQHKKDYNNRKGALSVHALFDKYGIDNCDIILLELCPCTTKDEIFARESFYMKTMKCVNKKIMGRTKHEYYCDNKEEILQKRYDYHEKNKEQSNANHKKYNEKNKEHISASRGEIVRCECGCDLTKSTMKRHQKSAKHLKKMQEK